MLEIIDLFDDIWEIFNVWKPKLEKQVSLYETESVDTNRIVITINPKKIFWKIKNKIVYLEWNLKITRKELSL